MEGVHFSAAKHTNQRRKNPNQDPYINHPISVAKRLTDSGVTDLNVLLAALLHDTIEDTATSYSEIKEKFGEAVAKIVNECTDDKSLPKEVRKKLQISHAKEISLEAKLVKMADKLDNTTGLAYDPPSGWKTSEVEGCALWSYCVCRNLRFMDEEETKNPLTESVKTLSTHLDKVFSFWNFASLSEEQLVNCLEKYYNEINHSDYLCQFDGGCHW